MTLTPTAVHAEIPATVSTQINNPTLKPNGIPNRIELAPTVSGKIFLNSAPGICSQLKVK
ncbi:hypothetical protein RIF25_10055 [Thermosynechococcaceae cyanobacterium BACA0444]|uniref:Uncharacterized protein n=1 Tax=Pseudocalidococcus azoricus BACA0444 TaxID=2918990 RepID=A0AAE4JXK1_9CYAN|nr:hypothetical protein [Pseudocalidococcus azoricus]MDS3861148.1 hypothetical protein [Pseudocalidococcus azoricus BACA0444]